MRPRSRWSEAGGHGADPRPSDDGSASLEFLVTGLVLLVPLVYLVVSLGLIQHGSLGVESAARHTARAITLADDAADADRQAQLVREGVAAEYGLDPAALEIEMSCPETSGACPAAGATVAVTVRARIALPFVPPVLGLDRLATVPVEATSVQKASRLWGS